MTGLKWLFAVALLVILIGGCVKQEPTCKDESWEKSCEGTELKETSNCGTVRPVETCDYKCENGACTEKPKAEPQVEEKPPVCTDSSWDKLCEGDELKEKSNCGTTRSVQICDYKCESGACIEKPKCTDRVWDKFCEGAELKEKSNCETVRPVETCQYGCANLTCSPKPPDAAPKCKIQINFDSEVFDMTNQCKLKYKRLLSEDGEVLAMLSAATPKIGGTDIYAVEGKTKIFDDVGLVITGIEFSGGYAIVNISGEAVGCNFCTNGG